MPLWGVFKEMEFKIATDVKFVCTNSLALIYHLPFIVWQGLDSLNSQNVWSVLYAGIFPSILAPLVWMLAVQHLGPNRTSIFMNLMPVFTAMIAYFWLAEIWSSYHTMGGVIIVLGIILAQIKKKATNSV